MTTHSDKPDAYLEGIISRKSQVDENGTYLPTTPPHPTEVGEAVMPEWADEYDRGRFTDAVKFLAGFGFYAAANPAPAAVNGAMSEKDRIEFALRDAGFDLERAFAIAELATANSAEGTAAPDGYVLVPREPTEEMIDALCGTPFVIEGEMHGNTFVRKEHYDQRYITDAWEAMLNATASTSRGS